MRRILVSLALAAVAFGLMATTVSAGGSTPCC
jgi:hypothetical protein